MRTMHHAPCTLRHALETFGDNSFTSLYQIILKSMDDARGGSFAFLHETVLKDAARTLYHAQTIGRTLQKMLRDFPLEYYFKAAFPISL